MPSSGFPATPYRTPYPIEEDRIEDTQKYVVGGYHPVNIGDWLGSGDKRYQVIHKLGSGGFATVWWAQSSVDQRHYALKVMCANAVDDRELETMRQLWSCGAKHPNISVLLDSFHIDGPNGKHMCLVFPLLGPSL